LAFALVAPQWIGNRASYFGYVPATA